MKTSFFGRVAALFLAVLALAFPPAAFAAAGVTADVTAGVSGAYTGANNITSLTPTFPLALTGLVRFSPGTASGQADKMFADYRTIAASGTDNLDLAGSLTDPLGVTLTFAKVKAIIIIADAGNTNDVQIGPGASNPFSGPFSGTTPLVSIKPGGVFIIAHPGTGWTVTASTGDILKIANSSSGTSVSYKIIIIGTSA